MPIPKEAINEDDQVLCSECGGNHVSLRGFQSHFVPQPEDWGAKSSVLMLSVCYLCLDCRLRHSVSYTPSSTRQGTRTKLRLIKCVTFEYGLEYKWAKEAKEAKGEDHANS